MYEIEGTLQATRQHRTYELNRKKINGKDNANEIDPNPNEFDRNA